MLKSDFYFELPPELIAQAPLQERIDSRLLVLEPQIPPSDRKFQDLPGLLRPGDLLVLNDTRVIPARLYGAKATGGRIEILLERILDPVTALVHLRASKSPKPGSRLLLDGGYECEVIDRRDSLFVLRFADDSPVMAVLEDVGHIPLPPYIDRADTVSDRERYQTVFSVNLGAVAAPTAGLHFDQAMLDRLEKEGIERVTVTLHVGSGTFLPVRAENLNDHQMHSEFCQVSSAAVATIQKTKARGGGSSPLGLPRSGRSNQRPFQGNLLPMKGRLTSLFSPGFHSGWWTLCSQIFICRNPRSWPLCLHSVAILKSWRPISTRSGKNTDSSATAMRCFLPAKSNSNGDRF